MAKVNRPELRRWEPQRRPMGQHRAVIFIHGILSDANSCFQQLLSRLDALDSRKQFDLWVFNYDYRRTFADSASDLCAAIRRSSIQNSPIDFVGHSMGGLVARMAVIQNDLQNVRRIVTLATPNHGTLHGVQLNLLGQTAALALRKIHPIYARAPGILDLTDAARVMRDAIEHNIASHPNRLNGKQYVSVPAQYYHTLRQIGSRRPSLIIKALSSVILAMNWAAAQKLVALQPVHDGIVEESSNRLYPAPVGSTSEMSFLANRSGIADSVLHVTHEACADCDHTQITKNDDVGELIYAVLMAASLSPVHIDAGLSATKLRVHYNPPVT